MDRAPAARGTQDITVVWIVFALAVVGLILAYWFLLYKPKQEDIRLVQASIDTKKSTLETYKKEASELLNYEDQFAAVVHQWNWNQHYFVNGLVDPDEDGIYTPPHEGREQWAVFDALEHVWGIARFSGVYLAAMYVSESLDYYMTDEPFDVPDELLHGVAWEPVVAARGENPDPLFTSHIFSVKIYGSLPRVRKFIESLQKMEGEVQLIWSIHCFETADKPAYRLDVVGLSDVVLTDITLEIDMMLSLYEVNPDAATANTPPDLPGTASCSYTGGGGGGGGRGGGSRGSSGAGVALGL